MFGVILFFVIVNVCVFKGLIIVFCGLDRLIMIVLLFFLNLFCVKFIISCVFCCFLLKINFLFIKLWLSFCVVLFDIEYGIIIG